LPVTQRFNRGRRQGRRSATWYLLSPPPSCGCSPLMQQDKPTRGAAGGTGMTAWVVELPSGVAPAPLTAWDTQTLGARDTWDRHSHDPFRRPGFDTAACCGAPPFVRGHHPLPTELSKWRNTKLHEDLIPVQCWWCLGSPSPERTPVFSKPLIQCAQGQPPSDRWTRFLRVCQVYDHRLLDSFADQQTWWRMLRA
jgi:hypothetical protein